MATKLMMILPVTFSHEGMGFFPVLRLV